MVKYTSLQIKAAIKAYFTLGSLRKAQQEVNIPKSSIHVWIQRLGQKTVDKRKGCKKPNRKKRFGIELNTNVNKLLIEDPYRTVVQVHLEVKEQMKCSLSTVQRTVNSLGLSRKRASRMLNPQSPERKQKIQDFCELMKTIPVEEVSSVDEVSFDTRMKPFYGYTPKGQRLVAKQTLTSRDRHSVVCGVTVDGVIDNHHIIHGSANTKEFLVFLEGMLSKCTQRFILMDNVAFHRSKLVSKAIEDAGKTVIFVPPYSPQFNPIEHVFSSMKKCFRESRSLATTALTGEDLDDFITAWKTCVQPTSWKKTFDHCLRTCLHKET